MGEVLDSHYLRTCWWERGVACLQVLALVSVLLKLLERCPVEVLLLKVDPFLLDLLFLLEVEVLREVEAIQLRQEVEVLPLEVL